MNTKSASFRTLLEDIKISFKFAVKNIISYILGMLGVLVVTGLLMALVALLVIVPIFIAIGGFQGLFQIIMSTIGSWETTDGLWFVSATTILLVPIILSPLFVAIGALFGMSREVVESNGTTAQGVFIWYKSKFFPIAGAGIIAFLIVFGPSLLLLLVMLFAFGTITGWGSAVLGAFALVWGLIATGCLSMLFPAVIDGNSVKDALVLSVKMAIRYFDRVLSTWFAFAIPILLVPLLASTFSQPFMNPNVISIAGPLLAVFGLFVVFIGIPATTIALTRVYLILSGETREVNQEHDLQIHMVGGE